MAVATTSLGPIAIAIDVGRACCPCLASTSASTRESLCCVAPLLLLLLARHSGLPLAATTSIPLPTVPFPLPIPLTSSMRRIVAQRCYLGITPVISRILTLIIIVIAVIVVVAIGALAAVIVVIVAAAIAAAAVQMLALMHVPARRR